MLSYFPPSSVDNVLSSLARHKSINVSVVGFSVNAQPIHMLSYGDGPFKVLAWSQMHGNETTTTIALLKLLTNLSTDYSKSEFTKVQLRKLNDRISLYAIPQLNPDGSLAHSRENAKAIDLNRDFQQLSQPESRVLFDVFNAIQPDLCLNLHEQRSIFASGKNGKPTTLAFLAPSTEHKIPITNARLQAMHYINNIKTSLKSDLNCHIARYDDEYNPNCVGEKFTSLGTPTILFEAGYITDDPKRTLTPDKVYQALKSLLFVIPSKLNDIALNVIEKEYNTIPQNEIQYVDILLKNVNLRIKNKTERHDVLYANLKPILKGSNIQLIPILVKGEKYDNPKSHYTLECPKYNVINTQMNCNDVQLNATFLRRFIEMTYT